MNKIVFGIVNIFLFIFSLNLHAEVKLDNLRCEMLENPIGIDVVNPNLSWNIKSNERGVSQNAYRIIVASSKENLDQNIGDMWDSDKVESDQSIQITYQGKKLESRKECFWKVKVWTSHGESEWSSIANWSMGFIYYKDWQGRWIGFDRVFPWDSDSFNSRLSARYFRKEFKLNKTIEKARVYIIGLGLYELFLNGKKIGDQVLTPSPTDYTKNVKYNVFDVTEELQQGENAIGVILGNGRYYTMRQHYKAYKIKNFGFPKMLVQLEVEYDDGSTRIITTDSSWRGTANGPIRSNNEYDGEEYDAQREMPGWSKPGFNDTDWLDAEYVEEPRGEFEAQMNPYVKVLQTIKPVSIKEISKGRYILDIGQNIAGWIKLKVKGNRGDQVQLRFAEILQDNGELFTANLRDAKACDLYTLKGEGEEVWEPKFVYHGFQFVEIIGFPGTPTLDNFEAKVVSDEIDKNGEFTTSNSLINQLFKNAYWGVLSNYKGIPIDCPQRDERQPWLGERAVGCYSESYIFGNELLYRKWIDDIAYSQKADGSVCDVAPSYFRYYSDNMTWPGTFLFVADMLYRQYGDVRPIVKHYDAMKKWMFYMRDRYLSDEYILTQDRYGDWCAPPKTIEEGRGKSADVKYPSQLISTTYFYHFLGMMQQFATLSGNEQDILEYKELAEKVKNNFDKNFYRPELSGYGENKLTDNILALYMDLVPENKKKTIAGTIEDIIVNENKGHLSTGMIGTKWIMRTLTDHNRTDIAYQLATNKTYPSWGYMIENGAKVIWELWNGNTASPRMNSYNHVMMLGDLIIWYYESLAGIKSSDQSPGFKQIIMKPEIINQLDYVNASYNSVHGLIKSNWEKKDNTFNWDISIPANTNAIVYFPSNIVNEPTENGLNINEIETVRFLRMEGNRKVYQVGSGDYSFHSEMKK